MDCNRCAVDSSVSGMHMVKRKGLGRTKTANPVSNSACCTSIGKLRCLLGKLSHSNREDSPKEWIKGQVKLYIPINMTLSHLKYSDAPKAFIYS